MYEFNHTNKPHTVHLQHRRMWDVAVQALPCGCAELRSCGAVGGDGGCGSFRPAEPVSRGRLLWKTIPWINAT